MKKTLSVLCLLMAAASLGGCGNKNIAHEHTFSEAYSHDESSHWKDATCEHKELSSDRGAHIDIDDDGECDICHRILSESCSFNFVGYHCSLNNETSYEKGSNVVLTFSVDEGYHLPETITVIGASDYTYNESNKTLVLTVNNDVTVVVNAIEDERPEPAQYIVSFVTNSDSIINPILVTENETFVKPDDPVKPECVFMGWYTTSDCSGEPYSFGTRVTGDLILYALWGGEITFLNYDGSTYLTLKVRLNGKVNKPQNPEYLDAHFAGWYDNIEHDGNEFDFNTPITKNLRLYAQFSYIITYLSFDKSLYKTEIIPLGERISKPVNPSLDYHDFDAWYIDETFLEKFEFNNIITEDLTLFSKFIPKKYDIVYHDVEGMVHSNPSYYTYGAGLDLVNPTVDGVDCKFYGWYFDAEFTLSATSIPTDAHGQIDIFAKRAELFDINYVNWPEGIENPNPTSYTKYDEFIIDISDIKNEKGVVNASFTINGEAVPGVAKNTTGNLEINIVYTLTKTEVIIDPNRGELLPKDPYIFVDFKMDGVEKVKVPVSSINDSVATDIYDSNVLSIPSNGRNLFSGFSFSPISNLPLSETEINNLDNGSTIYALWSQLPEEVTIVPTSYENVNGGKINKILGVHSNVNKLNFNFTSSRLNSGTVSIMGTGSSPKNLFTKAVSFDSFNIKNVEIDVSEHSVILLRFEYEPYGSEDAAYSYSLENLEYKSLSVRAKASENPLKTSLSYWDVFEMEDPYREDHTFVGWFDQNGNKVESGSQWTSTNEKEVLTARYRYNNLVEFVNDLVAEYERLEGEFKYLTYIEEDDKNNYLELLENRLSGGLDSLDDDIDYETGLLRLQNAKDELNRIYYSASSKNVEAAKLFSTDRLKTLVNAYIDLLGYLDEDTANAYKGELNNALNDGIEAINSANSISQIQQAYTDATDKLAEIYGKYGK